MNLLKLFPATRPLEAVAMDIQDLLPKTRSGKEIFAVISDKITKLNQTAALDNITARNVAVALCEVWIFEYGISISLLTDIVPQAA